MNSKTISAIDDLKMSCTADPALLTAKLTDFIINLSSTIDTKVTENKIDATKAIFKIYDLGMIGVL